MNQDRLNLLFQLLNQIEVHGQQNLNNLLACIQLVQGLKEEDHGNDSN